MIGWILFGASAYAAYLWGNWLAIGNAVANLWSLGVMSNYGPGESGGGDRLAVTVNAVTSLIGLGLLVAAMLG